MGMNDTPSANRVHIGIFGKRNAGKSSVINALTGQNLAVVSDVKGTTTDPVYKAMEILPLGPVVLIDTPGIDDEGPLGELRVKKARQVLNKTDAAVLVVDAARGCGAEEKALLQLFAQKQLPYLIVYNKCDLLAAPRQTGPKEICISAEKKQNIEQLKERLAALAAPQEPEKRLVGDLLAPADLVVLVVPIDSAAPKGRLILPQQQTIRDILESNATAIVVKETGLHETLHSLGKKPRMVITDSQAFAEVSAVVPPEIPLTSFSILFARYKGVLETAIQGAAALDTLQDGDAILIAEGCTHHRQCDDIGTVKLPRWIRTYTGSQPAFSFTSGGEFPEDLQRYKLIIHCGACMLNEREMQYRRRCAQEQNVPMTNYGIAIARMKGILKRSIALFPNLLALLNENDRDAQS
ncbi:MULTISPECIES: [FeFe] hydrogenase H-cluster maturation GTPase HydF [Caproicibacterium]|uniref:[FeFe] hydrogenase H-cluster maturation GTPase HydF n=1 Tax=Caproicibacterium argilliputei TaxID=3030016 RepID=A0AA97H0F9_9FIRM|nr:[FeFe] hydrogenase H-cluster maturation GTPase HydF [Caproicibacterium argilliputei]WOC31486.1 [FeFe] hydrogenase H-cluster maturation GTPase HydF [Caproicibacterium argilliputei]